MIYSFGQMCYTNNIQEMCIRDSLSDKQALELLEKKWIVPLVESIYKLPDTVIDSLVSKIQALQSLSLIHIS